MNIQLPPAKGLFRTTDPETNENVVVKFGHLEKELSILRKLTKASSVIRLVRTWTDDNQVQFLVLESCNYDALQDVQAHGCYSVFKCRSMIADISNALLAVAMIGYCHRDVTLENIGVMTMDAQKSFKFKLLDFDLAEATQDRASPRYNTCGKKGYLAPEILDPFMQRLDGFTMLPYDASIADVFALGVCAFAALTNLLPSSPAMVIRPWIDDVSRAIPESSLKKLVINMLWPEYTQRYSLLMVQKAVSELNEK